ncbi:MAG: hypothetical protein U5K74_07375 [Gemmatimonadaceae bacterium]|nr:hypothetical protein [Gemmatimonadaceae bacterium]
MLFGALAGMAVGILLADRGVFSGARSRPRRSARKNAAAEEPSSTDIRPIRAARAARRPANDEAELEARVLETFQNDPGAGGSPRSTSVRSAPGSSS